MAVQPSFVCKVNRLESCEFEGCALSLREEITAITGIFFGAEEIFKKKFTLQF
jgi:hypothetical protein